LHRHERHLPHPGEIDRRARRGAKLLALLCAGLAIMLAISAGYWAKEHRRVVCYQDFAEEDLVADAQKCDP
jgi:hypothetical protein